MNIDISHAMSYIHKRGLIHRYLKIDNIRVWIRVWIRKLLISDLWRFFDFNKTMHSCRQKWKEETNTTIKQMFTHSELLLIILFFWNLPKIKNDNYISFPNSSKSASHICLDLISRCLAYDPKDRPTFDVIISDIQMN